MLDFLAAGVPGRLPETRLATTVGFVVAGTDLIELELGVFAIETPLTERIAGRGIGVGAIGAAGAVAFPLGPTTDQGPAGGACCYL